MFSMAAAGLYALVMLACAAAAIAARSNGQRAAHVGGWMAVAGLFALLVWLRVGAVEDIVRDHLREVLKANGEYEHRRALQLPLVVGAIIGAAFLFAWPVRAWHTARGRRDRAIAAALLGAAVMVVLVALRTISFSPLDSLLYGPVKLNWVADIGAACLILGAAVYYARVVRQAPPSTREPAR